MTVLWEIGFYKINLFFIKDYQIFWRYFGISCISFCYYTKNVLLTMTLKLITYCYKFKKEMAELLKLYLVTLVSVESMINLRRNLIWSLEELSASSHPKCSLLLFISRKKLIIMIGGRKLEPLEHLIFGLWGVFYTKCWRDSFYIIELTGFISTCRWPVPVRKYWQSKIWRSLRSIAIMLP